MTSPWTPPSLMPGMTIAVGRGASRLMQSAIAWEDAVRIIGSEFAGESLFDRVASPSEFDALVALADLTNPTVRAAQGHVDLVPLIDRIYGPGTGLIMSAFSWPGRGSRFSDGSFGVFYAARTDRTAIAETVHHQVQFLAGIPPVVVDKTVLLVNVNAPLVDVRRAQPAPPSLYHPNDYRASRQFGASVRGHQAFGLVYDSVRDPPTGECVGIFRPPALAPVRVHRTLEYHWDGAQVTVR